MSSFENPKILMSLLVSDSRILFVSHRHHLFPLTQNLFLLSFPSYWTSLPM